MGERQAAGGSCPGERVLPYPFLSHFECLRFPTPSEIDCSRQLGTSGPTSGFFCTRDQPCPSHGRCFFQCGAFCNNFRFRFSIVATPSCRPDRVRPRKLPCLDVCGLVAQGTCASPFPSRQVTSIERIISFCFAS